MRAFSKHINFLTKGKIVSNTNTSDAIIENQASIVTTVDKVRALYHLTKPGITRMVVLTTTAGYFLAIPNFVTIQSLGGQILHFLCTVIGTVMTCAGSCMLNNYIERDFDKLMKRTINRGTVTGIVQPRSVLLLGIALCFLGIIVLSNINTLTMILAIATIVSYVFLYTPLKRVTTLSLFVGAIPGALPPLGGYTAVTSSIDATALILFSVLFLWQLPHFLALSWMYKQDYQRGGFKMTAVNDVNGTSVATQMIVYCIMLVVTAPLLTMTQATGYIYGAVSFLLGLIFLYFSVNFFRDRTHDKARNALLSSYAYLSGVIMVMFLDKQ